VLPQKFAILGIGIDKHKTNKTGRMDWTGITRHARADLDAFAALADLFAHEIAIQKSRLLEMIRTGDQLLWESKIGLWDHRRTKVCDNDRNWFKWQK